MDSVTYLKLMGESRGFQLSAELIEREIRRLNANAGETSPIGEETGWHSHHVWVSLKSVSHHNLAIALLLRLKCFLSLHRLDLVYGHRLTQLFDKLNIYQTQTSDELEEIYQQVIRDNPVRLIATISSEDSTVPRDPSNSPIKSLKDSFAFLEEYVEIWTNKRSGMYATSGPWQYHFDSLEPLFEFLNLSENLAARIAYQNGVLNRVSTEPEADSSPN